VFFWAHTPIAGKQVDFVAIVKKANDILKKKAQGYCKRIVRFMKFKHSIMLLPIAEEFNGFVYYWGL